MQKKSLDTKFSGPVALGCEMVTVRKSRGYSITLAIFRYCRCTDVKCKSSDLTEVSV